MAQRIDIPDRPAPGAVTDTMTPAGAAEMIERYRALGEEWLRDHPVIDPPPGFQVAPEQLGPYGSSIDERSGWFGQNAEGEALAFWPDGRLGREMVATVAQNPDVLVIALWDGPRCLWAATRV